MNVPLYTTQEVFEHHGDMINKVYQDRNTSEICLVTDLTLSETDLIPQVVYQCICTSETLVIPLTEFTDDRFEIISD